MFKTWLRKQKHELQRNYLPTTHLTKTHVQNGPEELARLKQEKYLTTQRTKDASQEGLQMVNLPRRRWPTPSAGRNM